MKNSAILTISIVNFNGGDFLLQCLSSLKKVKDEISFEVWVVDNNSSDGSLEKAKEKFEDVNFLETGENLGFGKAQNLVLKKLTTKYVLILNPDSEVLPNTLRTMISFMEDNPKVGAASCRVQKSDGSLDIASHRGFPTPWASFKYYFLGDDSAYHLTFENMEEIHEVDSIVGAFFLTRKEVLDKVGLFDEAFFMYGEDLDLCFRIKKSGFKVMYVPTVSIIHHKGVSSGLKEHSQKISSADLETRQKSFNAFYDAMTIFYKKHYKNTYPFMVNWLVYLGINFKKIIAKRKMNV